MCKKYCYYVHTYVPNKCKLTQDEHEHLQEYLVKSFKMICIAELLCQEYPKIITFFNCLRHCIVFDELGSFQTRFFLFFTKKNFSGNPVITQHITVFRTWNF